MIQSRRLRIVTPGVATTIQDTGRPGWAHLGVAPSGAVDPALAALVNRIVGNVPTTAVVETTGGLTVEAVTPLLVASSVEPAPRTVHAGERFHVPFGHGRAWHYLAVRGGIDVTPTLDSRSTDTMGGLGPPPCVADDELPIGPDPGTPIAVDHAPLAQPGHTARLLPGPRLDWFAPSALGRLAGHWTVTTANRVGVRLSGPAIERVRHDELPSEGLVRGALQVPPDGQPVMMLADHPTTGGYPVIAVVHPDDVAVVAQTSAGTRVRFLQ